MNFPILILDYAVAKGQGTTQADAIKLALLGSFLKPPLLGLVLVSALAKRDAVPPVVTPVGSIGTTGGTIGSGTPGIPQARGSATGAAVMAALAPPLATPPLQAMPNFVGMDKAQVDYFAGHLKLTPVYEEGEATTGKVSWQEPGTGKPPANHSFKVKFK